jgi:hypothetical protein
LGHARAAQPLEAEHASCPRDEKQTSVQRLGQVQGFVVVGAIARRKRWRASFTRLRTSSGVTAATLCAAQPAGCAMML